MSFLKSLNIGVRFLLELCILAIFGYWGFETGTGMIMKILSGLGAPILFALLWGMFLAPKSPRRLQQPWSFLLEIAIFAMASWALYSTGQVDLSIAFGGIYVLNKTLMLVWGQ